MCATDKVWITELTLIHKNIRSVRNSHAQVQRSITNVKHIMMPPIKTITSVLKASTDNIKNIHTYGNAFFTWLTEILQKKIYDADKAIYHLLLRLHLLLIPMKMVNIECPDPSTNMATTGHSCFWLVDFLKIFSSETAWPNESKPGRKHPWKVHEKSNLYRGPSIDASYQVSVHLVKWFQRRFLEIDQSETRIACGGHVC
jgi:hypothetical protein